MKKKMFKKRNPVAKQMITSGLYRSKIIPNKKKSIKKMDLNKELSYYPRTYE